MKDEELRAKLIAESKNIKEWSDDLDNYVDDFVAKYDNDDWCRGNFKSQIVLLVIEAKQQERAKILEEIKPSVEKIRECVLGTNGVIVSLCEHILEQLSEKKE